MPLNSKRFDRCLPDRMIWMKIVPTGFSAVSLPPGVVSPVSATQTSGSENSQKLTAIARVTSADSGVKVSINPWGISNTLSLRQAS